MAALLTSALVMLSGIAVSGRPWEDGTGCNVTWPASANSTTDVLFYITPTAKTSNLRPDCPSGVDAKHCVTLDEFTTNELPNIKAQARITLIFSKGTHNSTVPINFVNVEQVNLCGNQSNSNSTLNGSSTAVRQTEPPLIRLLSGNITVCSTNESLVPVSLEIINLAINGSGKCTLAVMNNAIQDSGGYISISHVKVFGMVFQVVSGMTCPIITISDASFLASMIELYGCVFNGITNIFTNSNFSSAQQPYTIAICKAVPQISDTDSTFEAFDSTLLQIILDMVNVVDLSDHLPIPQLPSLCSLSPWTIFVADYHPTDIYIDVQQVSLNITNSYFSRSYGTAFKPQHAYFDFTVINSIFTGYTQGVLVFNGDLKGVTINLINTTLANNSISNGETIKAAVGLSIVPNNAYFLTDFSVTVSGCLFEGNVDTVGNLQVVKLHGVTNIIINNTNFTNNNSTAIDADLGNLTFSGNITFQGNRAWQAGALSLGSTTMTIAENANVVFSNNYATHFGGAIFINNPTFYLQNDKSSVLTFCFYQPLYSNYEFGNAKVSFFSWERR